MNAKFIFFVAVLLCGQLPRSVGQESGTALWEIAFAKPGFPPFFPGWIQYVLRPPAVAPDGTIYIALANRGGGSNPGARSEIDGVSSEGTSTFQVGGYYDDTLSTAIAPDGTIYSSGNSLVPIFPSLYGTFVATTPDRIGKWQFTRVIENYYGSQNGFGMAAISGNGVYVGFGEYGNDLIYGIDFDGNKQWQVPLLSGALAVGLKGTIYSGYGPYIAAFNTDGTKIWDWSKAGNGFTEIAIGADGTLYFGGDTNLFALNTSGSNTWIFSSGGSVVASPAVGTDGTIYFGSYDKNLYAVNPDGTRKWSFQAASEINTTPALAADGTIYFGTLGTNFYALNSDGTMAWTFQTRESSQFSPAIGTNGAVYVAAGSTLYVLKGSIGVADAPWPMYRHDAGHTASLSTTAILPGTPVGVVASQGEYGVTIGWRSVVGAANYEVWRSTFEDIATPRVLLAKGVGATTNYFDTAPESGMTNFYWVKATGVGGSSDFSSSVLGVSRAVKPGDKKWELTLGARIFGDPVVGPDGTAYVSVGNFGTLDRLYTLSPNGAVKGSIGSRIFTSLTMSDSGVVYGLEFPPALRPLSISSAITQLYELTSQGLQHKASATAPPAIDLDGSLKFGTAAGAQIVLTSLGLDGKTEWQFNAGGWIRSKPAIGPDGTIYTGAGTNFFAINPIGDPKWNYHTNLNLDASAAIGRNGEVYLVVQSFDYNLPGNLFLALNPDGREKWVLGWSAYFSQPAIASDGTIYIGSVSNFYALNPDASVKWTFTEGPGYYSSPALSTDGLIYFTSGTNLYALDSTGATRWVFTNPKGISSAPFLAEDGTIYFYAGSTLVAVKGTTGNLIHPWPMQAHDARHTSRASRLPLTTNNPPTISPIPNQFGCIGKRSFGIEFAIGDVETLPDSLNIQATSSNQSLVPDGNISFRGSGTNRTMFVFPAAGQSGQSLITVTVTDGDGASSSTTFLVILGGCPNPVENDFNRDGMPDIVFEHQDGSIGVWFMNNGPDLFSASPFNPSQLNDARWRIVAAQDLNGDGRTDLLFQHEDGTLAVWCMNGIDLVTTALLSPSQPGEAWRVAATGDLNRDGKKDILFQHTDGTLGVWFMDGINLIQGALLNPNHPGDSRWRVVGTADLTLTGNTDLILQHTDGTLAAWYMDRTNLVRSALLNPPVPAEEGWQVAGTLDLNKDGKTDLLFQHDHGTVAVWLMDGINLISGQLLNPANPGDGWRIVGPRINSR